MDYCKINSNGKNEIGAIAPSDIPIEVRDKNYAEDFTSLSNHWEVHHGLGKRPAVTLLDEFGNQMFSDITHIDDDNLIVDYQNYVLGKILCN